MRGRKPDSSPRIEALHPLPTLEQPGSQEPGAIVTTSEEVPILALSMPGSSGRPRQMRAASVSDHRSLRQAPVSIRGSLR